MLELLGVLEGDVDRARDVVVLVVDRQLELLLPHADFVLLLVLPQLELYVDLHRPRQSSEEGRQLLLNQHPRTIAIVDLFISSELVVHKSHHSTLSSDHKYTPQIIPSKAYKLIMHAEGNLPLRLETLPLVDREIRRLHEEFSGLKKSIKEGDLAALQRCV